MTRYLRKLEKTWENLRNLLVGCFLNSPLFCSCWTFIETFFEKISIFLFEHFKNGWFIFDFLFISVGSWCLIDSFYSMREHPTIFRIHSWSSPTVVPPIHGTSLLVAQWRCTSSIQWSVVWPWWMWLWAMSVCCWESTQVLSIVSQLLQSSRLGYSCVHNGQRRKESRE